MKKGSFTIEASIWISFILFLYMVVLEMGISFFQDALDGEELSYLQEIDAVSEFYNYQVLKEMTGEWWND